MLVGDAVDEDQLLQPPRIFAVQLEGQRKRDPAAERMSGDRDLPDAAPIEQLQLAQSSGDGNFYDLSVVEARLKALIASEAPGLVRLDGYLPEAELVAEMRAAKG
mgnify:CR=1 FL=1